MSGLSRQSTGRRQWLMAMALGLGLAGTAVAQTTVKLGCVLPLSGGSAAVGNQTRAGVIAAVEQVNAAGGIKSLGGAKLQALFGDSQSKADVGSRKPSG